MMAARARQQASPTALVAANMPPVDRIHNHAAAELLEVLMDTSTDALISACDHPKVRTAVVALIQALVEVRDTPKGKR